MQPVLATEMDWRDYKIFLLGCDIIALSFAWVWMFIVYVLVHSCFINIYTNPFSI